MKILKIFIIGFVLIILFFAYHFSSNAVVTTEEVFRPDETEQTERSVKNFLRVVKENKTSLDLKITCIDPADIASNVLNSSHASILMSGTLSPTDMYRDILGLKNVEILELASPFEKDHQLTLVVDDVTTKYTMRTREMYKKIGENIFKTPLLWYNKHP